jgi:diguanylate cyclase (GGDEF)-like protein
MGLMDHLSQLGNRRHFETRLQELFDASKASGLSSVLMIDMDHFKAVNDKHGHDAGDALIVGFANALRKVVRQTDVLARLGGDEFCIIYSYAPLEKATVLAERLRKQLPREILLTKGVMHQLRWTGGLSAMSDKDTKPDDVLWRADQALLQAKEAGRNVTKVSDPVAGLPAKKKIIVG